jgi:hypothetical protein
MSFVKSLLRYPSFVSLYRFELVSSSMYFLFYIIKLNYNDSEEVAVNNYIIAAKRMDKEPNKEDFRLENTYLSYFEWYEFDESKMTTETLASLEFWHIDFIELVERCLCSQDRMFQDDFDGQALSISTKKGKLIPTRIMNMWTASIALLKESLDQWNAKTKSLQATKA